MSTFEIEIKSHLLTEENAHKLITKLKANDPNCECTSTSSQLNHYFHEGDFEQLYTYLEDYFDDHHEQQYLNIKRLGTHFSVRTRQTTNEHGETAVIFVIKSSVDDTTSENGLARLEFEAQLPLTLDELDGMLEKSGFEYQAKWSRNRQEFCYENINVCIDKNAGYGYLAEFEAVVHSHDEIEEVKTKLHSLMKELELEELDQTKLAKMFDYYNNNWQDYYGSDKVFEI